MPTMLAAARLFKISRTDLGRARVTYRGHVVERRRPLLLPVILTVVMLAGVGVLVTVGLRGILSDRHSVRGQVQVTGCTFLTYELHGGDEYRCGGNFVADDGALRLPYVSFDHQGDLAPGTRAAVRVSGPGATEATETAQSGWRLAVTSGLSLCLLFLVSVIWWAPRRPRRVRA